MSSDDESPIQLVRPPECTIKLLDFVRPEVVEESPAGDVELRIEFTTVFTRDHPFYSLSVTTTHRRSLGEFTEDAVVGMLSTVYVPRTIISSDLGFVVDRILVSGRRLVSHAPPGCKALRMSVRVSLSVDRIPAELDSDDNYFDSDDGDGVGEDAHAIGFVPASEESIEGLERVRISDEDEMKLGLMACTVCLEDMPVGSEASRLPCQHRFHGDCIVEWLRTSKLCPVCRFEMPS